MFGDGMLNVNQLFLTISRKVFVVKGWRVAKPITYEEYVELVETFLLCFYNEGDYDRCITEGY